MTSMAFVLGVVPLLFSHGAGAEMRQSLGVAVFSGMLGVTFFGVLLTPVFFYVIDTRQRVALLRQSRRCGAWARVLLVIVAPFVLWRELFKFARRGASARSAKLKNNTEIETEIGSDNE